jgi:hypothetical protein
MIRFHGEKSVWPVIKAQIKRSKNTQQIFAAIAYIGADGTKIMPLRRGDVLVCNASDAAIKQGSTSAKALKTFFDRGVRIFNEPRLHGKVVVFPKKVFVGSANVSTRSMDILFEAVVETTDPKIIGSSLRFVQGLAQEISKIDREEMKRLQGLPVAKLPPPPPMSKSWLELPKQVSILKVVPVQDTAHSAKTEEQINANMKSVRSEFFKSGSRADIQTLDWSSKFWSEVKPNMWIITVDRNGRMSCPKQVIKLSKVAKTYGVVWLAKPKQTRNSAKDVDLLLKIGFNWNNGKLVVLRDEKTRSLLKIFQEN